MNPRNCLVEHECIRYTLPKPTADGRTTLTLTPLQLLDRLALLIPPPRARAPPEFDDADADAGVTLPFDQSAPWDAITAPLAP